MTPGETQRAQKVGSPVKTGSRGRVWVREPRSTGKSGKARAGQGLSDLNLATRRSLALRTHAGKTHIAVD